jgi:hypothetical protein
MTHPTDLAKPETLTLACADADCILHLAGVLFATRPEEFLPRTNIGYVQTFSLRRPEFARQKIHSRQLSPCRRGDGTRTSCHRAPVLLAGTWSTSARGSRRSGCCLGNAKGLRSPLSYCGPASCMACATGPGVRVGGNLEKRRAWRFEEASTAPIGLQ